MKKCRRKYLLMKNIIMLNLQKRLKVSDQLHQYQDLPEEILLMRTLFKKMLPNIFSKMIYWNKLINFGKLLKISKKD